MRTKNPHLRRAAVYAVLVLLCAGCIQQHQEADDSLLCTEHPEIYQAIKEYPWVKWAARRGTMPEVTYVEHMCRIADRSPVAAYLIAHTMWISDFVSENEAEFLKLIVDISEKDPSLAESVVGCWWTSDTLSDREIRAVGLMYQIALKNSGLATQVASSEWFRTFVTAEEIIVLEILADVPADLSLNVSSRTWFTDFLTHEEVLVLQGLKSLYQYSPQLTFEVVDLESFQAIDRSNVTQLERVTRLIEKDQHLFERLRINPLTTESWRIWSSLSAIGYEDRQTALTLLERLPSPVENSHAYLVENLTYLFSADSSLAHYLEEEGYLYDFTEKNGLFIRFLAVLSDFAPVDDYPSVIQAARFASEGLVYEDRFEKYRYHLLWQTTRVLPCEVLTPYRVLVKVSLDIYGERFYDWNRFESDLTVLSGDEFLNDLEFSTYISLIEYFMKEDLMTDVTEMSEHELSYLLDIPYQYLVNLDGTITATESTSSPLMRGNAAIFAIAHNVFTLSRRKASLLTEWENPGLREKYMKKEFALVDAIVQKGDDRDRLFIFISARNWESPTEEACICHTYQSMMDLKSVGIPATMMYWFSGESAHLYPAYIPGSFILEEVKNNPGEYDTPFLYSDFISPWDRAGYRDLKPRDILLVQIHDSSSESLVTIWGKPRSPLDKSGNLVIFLVLMGILIVVALVVAKQFLAMRIT
ncbi:MAG: hypothetical protein HXS52_09655 [Theionarchaea archaeon]|nr:hypothetical protein [Theionarchaea archaeon]MBU7038188.1 hypothetical protein [Theionarchaea archaeon]